jgi:hypothetical protein
MNGRRAKLVALVLLGLGLFATLASYPAAMAAETSRPSGVLIQAPGQVDQCQLLSQAANYIGNRNSKKFHLPTCRSLPAPSNQVFFKTRDEAIGQGYVPCKICDP